MTHPYSTRIRLDALDDLEASSSIGPDSPDVLIPHYSDILNNIPFMALDVDSMEDNETSDLDCVGLDCVGVLAVQV